MLDDAKKDFDEAIKEIRLLINYAKRNQKQINRYATFNKAAIVLLCAKFEAFIESFLEEYAYAHLQKSSNKTLNTDIHDHLIDCLIESLSQTKNNKIKRKSHIKDLVTLCGNEEISEIEMFKFNPRFNYGKHGQSEVERILKSFGFNTYLNEDHIKLFFTKFNALNNIRNNIIHQDGTPSLTHNTVDDYMNITCSFIEKLHTHAVLLIDD